MSFLVGFTQSLPAIAIVQAAMILIFLGFGIAKFAGYEQKSVGLLVANHPVLRHGPKRLGDAGFARLLGTIELFTATLLTLGFVYSWLGMLGGLLGAGTFLVTLSLFPFVQYFETAAGRAFLSSRGQFLFKDIALLAGCLAIAQHHASLLG